MGRAHDLIKGLRSTQASVVHVPYEVVCSIISEEIAEQLAMNITGFNQTAHKPNMPSKEAIEKAEMRRPHSLGTFEREDLLSVIEEMIDEAGGLEYLLHEVEDQRSPLQKARDAVGATIPFSPPEKKQEDDVDE